MVTNLLERLRLTQVKRFGIMHVNRDQSVAEHSYNVMLIAMYLVEGMDVDLQLEVMQYAIFHDMDEVFTGDIPSTFKRKLREECPAVKPTLDGVTFYPDEVKRVVKLADWLEVIYYLREFGGSRHTKAQMADMINNFYHYADTCGVHDAIRLKALKLEKVL